MEKNWILIASTPEMLVTRLWWGSLDFLLVNVHAPPTGRPIEEIATFWRSLRILVPSYLQQHPMILMPMHVWGLFSPPAVGGHGAEDETDSGAVFHSTLMDWDMWLPATFEECHWGPCHTWTHPRGSTNRLDYIAIPSILGHMKGIGRGLTLRLRPMTIFTIIMLSVLKSTASWRPRMGFMLLLGR